MALIGLVLCLLLDFEMMRWQTNHPGETYHDTHFARVLKWATFFDCIVLVLLHLLRYKVVVMQGALKNKFPRTVGLFINRQPRETRHCVIECLIAMLHVPPWLDFYTGINGGYPMHVNIFNVVILARVYLFARVMRNHSGFYERHIEFTASMNGVDSTTIFFNFKMLLNFFPKHLLLPILAACATATAAALVILERGDPRASIRTFPEALYATLICMSTVGFGDLTAVTPLGRVAVLIGGVFGGVTVCSLLVGVFVEGSATNAKENYVDFAVDSRRYRKRERQVAARMLQMVWRDRAARLGRPRSDPCADTNDRRWKDVMGHIHQLRKLRKHRPEKFSQEERVENTSKNLKRTVASLMGKTREKQEFFEVDWLHNGIGVQPTIKSLVNQQEKMSRRLRRVLEATYQIIDRE
jgi:hypothetical protein